MFISLVNKLGQLIDGVPKINRIRFYRNKVSEHWNDYSLGLDLSHFQPANSPATPSTSTVAEPEEREKIFKEMSTILNSFNDKNVSFNFIPLDQVKFCNIMDTFTNQFYETLEKIDPTLNKKSGSSDHDYLISNKLVELLFQFGFPSPIANVKEYSEDLVKFLTDKCFPSNNS